MITRVEVGYDPTVYVELDGCRRLLVEGSVAPGSVSKRVAGLAQGTAALVSYVGELQSS